MPLFRRDTQMNSDAIEAAQRDLDAEIGRAEAVVRERSLGDLRTGGDEADRASRTLVELQARRRVIQAALDEARRKEATDLEARDRREREARTRSFRAHLARVERHGLDLGGPE